MPRHSRRLAFEPLESRRLLAADSFVIERGILGIRGTNGDDVIDVRRVASGYNAGDLQVTLNDDERIFYYNYHWSGNWSINTLVILGRGGNDQITIADDVYSPAYIDGGKGDDTITTASMDDFILGGAGHDSIFAGNGHDAIDGGAGDDTILCGEGDDIALGGKGDDAIYGDEGADALAGEAGRDAVYGELGDDALSGGKGNDLLDGGIGSDLLTADAGIDHCYGGDGDDLFDGGSGNDFLFGEEGDDLIAAGAGNDECHGGAGSDGIFGDAGKDSLFGDDNNDHLDGGKGVDNCLGGDGNDQLKGGAGNDQLDGQAGDNLLDPDKGTDLATNGIPADLDQEYIALMPGNSSPSYIEYDLQNINGQLHTTIRIVTTGAGNLYSSVPVLIDGVIVAHVHSLFGTQTIELSPTPLQGQSTVPNDFPTIQEGSIAQISPYQAGTFVRAFII